MLKKLLITSVLLTHGYSAAPAQSSETIAGGGALSATLVDPVTQPSSVKPETQAKVYPNLPADCYANISIAAEAGDLNAVQEFIRNGVDPKAVKWNGETILHEAARSGNLDLVQYLIEEQGANPQAVDRFGFTILHEAARSRNLALVEYLVGLGADLRAATKEGKTVLHQAAYSGDLALATYLVGLGADPRTVDQFGCTVLHAAAHGGSLAVVKYLVSLGADLRAVTKAGQTVLHQAAYRGGLALATYLVGLGADPRAVDQYGDTVLHRAAFSGNLALVGYLVGLGADPRAVDQYGNTVLHQAGRRSLHILAYFAELGLEIPFGYREQINVIRQRASQALAGRQLRGPIDRASTLDKNGDPTSNIILWRRIGKYLEPIGVSKDDIDNERYIYPAEVDDWNDFSDEERSSILKRVQGVQSEVYLFHILEKIRFAGLKRLRDESLLLAELRSVGTGLFDDEAVDGNAGELF